MTRLLSLVLVALVSIPANAESYGPFEIVESKALSEIWLNAGMYSYHFQQDKGLNNTNLGVGVEYRHSNVAAFTAGTFYNSDRMTSHYVGWYWQPVAIGTVRIGAALGAVNGYPRMDDGDWFAALIPTASMDFERVGFNLFIISTDKDWRYGALSIQLKIRVD